MSNNHAHFSRSVNSSMNRKNRHLSGLIKYAVFTYTRHCLLRINTMATAYEEKCIKRAILPSGNSLNKIKMQHIYEYVATCQPHPLFFPLYLIFPLSNPSNCTVGSDSYISQWFSNTPHVFLSLPVQDVLLYIILNFDCHVTCVGVCQSGQYFTNVTPLYIQPSEIRNISSPHRF